MCKKDDMYAITIDMHIGVWKASFFHIVGADLWTTLSLWSVQYSGENDDHFVLDHSNSSMFSHASLSVSMNICLVCRSWSHIGRELVGQYLW